MALLEAELAEVVKLVIIGGLGVVAGLLQLPPSSIRLPRCTTNGLDKMAARIDQQLGRRGSADERLRAKDYR